MGMNLNELKIKYKVKKDAKEIIIFGNTFIKNN